MAPSEFDLRAALRDGEGEGLDADPLISQGRARAAHHRVRLLSGVAVVAVVAAGAVGASQLRGSGDSGSSSATGSAAGGVAAAPAHAPLQSASTESAYRVGGASMLAAKAAAIGCPPVAPEFAPPNGRTGRYGAAQPFFRQPVAAMIVCAYGSTRTAATAPERQPARLELSGSQATGLAASMVQASSLPITQPCPAGAGQKFAMIGLAGNGTRVGTVAADLDTRRACASTVANATAARYGWSPPRALERRLLALTPMAVPKSPVASATG